MPDDRCADSTETLNKAIIFAINAHKGQFKKGTNTPYILHPLEAAAVVATMTDDIKVITAAVLHDTVEDTKVTLDKIRYEFGNDIAAYVAAESEDKQHDRPAADTWEERKQATINFLNSDACKEEKMIALGDKLSNIRAIYWDYLSIGDKLWERFNQKDKTMHSKYYNALANALYDLRGYPAWQEYRKLVNAVFGN